MKNITHADKFIMLCVQSYTERCGLYYRIYHQFDSPWFREKADHFAKLAIRCQEWLISEH